MNAFVVRRGMKASRKKRVLWSLAVSGVLLAVAAHFFPALKDHALYSNVRSSCSGRIVLDGVMSGNHCYTGATLATADRGVRFSFAYAGLGQVLVQLNGDYTRGTGPAPVGYAVLRDPGVDGAWYCATGGTITVERGFDGEFTLEGVHELHRGADVGLAINGEADRSFAALRGTRSGAGAGPFEWRSAGTGTTQDRTLRSIVVFDETQAGVLFLAGDGPLIESTRVADWWMLFGDKNGDRELLHGAGTEASFRADESLRSVALTGNTLGTCGRGSNTPGGSVHASFSR